MPFENRIAFTLTEEEKTTVNGAITALKNVLDSKLIALSPDERQSMPKMSDKTLPFVEKVLEYSGINPDFNPPYMNVTGMSVDIAAYKQLLTFFRSLNLIVSKLDDTKTASGSEAYTMALTYYNSVKMAAKMNVPDAKPIYEDLRERFLKSSVTEEPQTETNNNPV